MINVVIAGCGALGRHVAAILSKEKHNVFMIDRDAKALSEAASTTDIATRQGSATDWQLLDDLREFAPSLFIALTGSDETNLVACSIAKQLNYPRALARIKSDNYLNKTRLDFDRLFDVDYFICPEVMIAFDILKYVISPGSLTVEYFANGALQLRTMVIPDQWENAVPLREFSMPGNIIVALIKRKTAEGAEQIIFPHGNDAILAGDEVTFVGDTDAVANLHFFFEIPQEEMHSVVLVGGGLTAIKLTRLLTERNIDVRIIEKNFDRCNYLAETLPEATIMHHDATDLDFLQRERIGSADLMVSCTDDDEVNMLTAILGKEIGCKKLITMLNNTSLIPIADKLGIRHTVSTRVSATNNILSQLHSGKINSLVSLYENQAQIMEINVSLKSNIVGIPLSELGPYLPKDFLIVMIQNRGRIMIAHGNRIISPGDTVIVVTSPKHVAELEEIF